jgi:Co/Zn/Cd efflux system component
MTPVGFQPMDEGDFDDSRANKDVENINVRAAMIHVVGDLVQTIGVMLSGIAIW